MKAIVLLCITLVVGCTYQTTSTPTCDETMGQGWGLGYGDEVESSSNLDNNRCVQVKDVWCCAL